MTVLCFSQIRAKYIYLYICMRARVINTEKKISINIMDIKILVLNEYLYQDNVWRYLKTKALLTQVAQIPRD